MRASEKTTINITLDDELQRRLNALGESRECSVDWLMKHAIENFIEREEQAEFLRQETLSRWEQVEVGKTVPHEKVTEWLNSWGSDHEKVRPECQ